MITVDLQCLGLRPGCRILDIGCGSGRHTAAAFDLNTGQVVGADPNIADLYEARERLDLHAAWSGRPRARQWDLAGADITRLPFAGGSFDLVICSEVLEHIPDHDAAVSETLRVLKPHSHLVVSVPRRWPETICWALSSQYRNTEGGHLRIYHARMLAERIECLTGLRLWRTHFAHSLHTPYWWLKCLVGPDRDRPWPVRQYNRLLTWDMTQRPALTRCLDRWLNPIMGKSVVLYFRPVAAEH